MRWSRLATHTWMVALTLGCTAPKPSAQHESDQREPAPIPTLYSLIPTVPDPEFQPGPAYFLSHDRVVALQGGAWTLIDDDRDKRVYALFEGANGQIYALGTRLVFALAEDRLVPIVELPSDSGLHGAAVGPESELALLTDTHSARHLLIHRYGAWRSTPIAVHDRLISSFAEFDRDSQLYMWTGIPLTRSTWSWRSPTIEPSPIAVPGAYQRATIALARTGDVYMFIDGFVRRLGVDGDNETFALLGVEQPTDATISATGTLALSWSSSCAVTRIELGEPVQIEAIDVDLDCNFEGHQHVIDDRDRIWVATPAGPWVLAPDSAPVLYGFGTVPLIGSGVYKLAVVGAGPELPQPGPVQVGGLTGQVEMVNGESPAGLVVELASMSSTWPSQYVFRTKTDAWGHFRFEAVPIGDYQISIPEHFGYFADGLGNAMREAEVHDLGCFRVYPPGSSPLFGGW